MKRKRLIGLLLTVALLCIAMVVQLVSAMGPDEDRVHPFYTVSQRYKDDFSDYYCKSFKFYYNDQLNYTATNNFEYYEDGTVGVKEFIRTVNGQSYTTNYTIKKEYDDEGRLSKFQSVYDDNNLGYKNEDYDFNYSNDGSFNIGNYNDGEFIPVATYDPEFNIFYDNGWTYEFEDGLKTRMYRTIKSGDIEYTHEAKFSYDYDSDSGKPVKKTYQELLNGRVLRTGTIDISYSGENTIHEETKTGQMSSGYETTETKEIYRRIYDKNNRLIESSYISQRDKYNANNNQYYTYDDHGNLLTVIDELFYDDQNGEIVPMSNSYNVRVEYSYDYHKRVVPVIPEDLTAKQSYKGAQESLNDGDDIDIEMTGALAGSIKTAGVETYNGSDSEYYFNKINKQIDDTTDLELSMNITGSAVGEIDADEPAPLRSIAIYEDNTFTKDHLVATGEDFDASVEALDNEFTPVSGMIRGTLAISAPKLTANNNGYNLTVTVPEDKLEKDKTYYFVIGRDMATNDLEAKSTNTDIVFEFTTGEVEEPEHEHTAGKPVRENEVAATCAKEGSYDEVVYCTECEEELSRETKIIAKIAHTEEAVPGKPATCTETGLTEGTKCSVCGDVLKAQEEIPALGHKEEVIKGKTATCTEKGLTDGTKCSVCGDVLKAQEEIPALGHKEEVVKGKAATCTEKGLTDGTKCSVCGDVLKAQEEISMLPHNYENGSCTVCGAKDPSVPDASADDLDPSVNGIVKCPDGVRWAMYKNGKVDTTCTTIAQNKYGWWRVENGYVNFDAQGIYQNKYGWWKTTNGKVTFKEFGLFENENGTWRVEGSKVNFLANGIYKGQDGNWYKTSWGKVTGDETGIFQNQFGWWYCKNSKVDFNYTGIASNQFGKWYIKSGKVDFTKVGMVKADGKTVMVMFGKVLFG